jgi:hypothetical protein
MEKIYFDDTTYIWKTKLNRVNDKTLFLEEANYIVDSKSKFDKVDAYPLNKNGWNNNLDFIGDFKIETKLDEIVQIGINKCKEIYNETGINYNKINTDAWVNVVRSQNPVQENFKYGDKYHTHTKIQEKMGTFFPHYTYVYYIQMPDVMNEEDGVLYFIGQNKKEYCIRPEEDNLIIMEGDMPHAPNNAPNSTLDRIVIAGNVGFELIKKQKSLI